jgi:hypothetical protein
LRLLSRFDREVLGSSTYQNHCQTARIAKIIISFWVVAYLLKVGYGLRHALLANEGTNDEFDFPEAGFGT